MSFCRYMSHRSSTIHERVNVVYTVCHRRLQIRDLTDKWRLDYFVCRNNSFSANKSIRFVPIIFFAFPPRQLQGRALHWTLPARDFSLHFLLGSWVAALSCHLLARFSLISWANLPARQLAIDGGKSARQTTHISADVQVRVCLCERTSGVSRARASACRRNGLSSWLRPVLIHMCNCLAKIVGFQ